MDRVRLAVVGVGHLGKEHARILATHSHVELVGVVDHRTAQAAAVAGRCGTIAFSDHRDLIDKVDAAVLAVPTEHHHAVALDFLRAGVPLLIEKPLASTREQAEELVSLARQRDLLLQVGHIERFNPAFEELARQPLQPRLIHARRLSPFTGRSQDIGVVLDLMIHDIDLILTLVGSPVREVSAVGLSVLGGHEDLAEARLGFANGCVAQLSASRIHTGPSRQMEVWAADGFAAVDYHQRRLTLVRPSRELHEHRQRHQRPDDAMLVELRTNLFGRFLHREEIDCNHAGPDQLTRELQEFVEAVHSGSPVRVTGEDGLEALTVASRILDSLRSHAWTGEATDPRAAA